MKVDLSPFLVRRDMIECKRLSDGSISVTSGEVEIGIIPNKEKCTMRDIENILLSVEELATDRAYEEGQENGALDKVEW